MPILQPEDHERMVMESVSFAKEEVKRRLPTRPSRSKPRRSALVWKQLALLVSRRSAPGFQFTEAFVYSINRIPAGEEEGMGWKTLGHRHTVEAVIHVLQGHGHSIIDGVRHDWAPGDFISVPMFSWHRHLNTGSEDFIYLAATTGPLSLALGLAVYEDERYPDYWVFGHKSESAMKSMIPGADDSTRVSLQAVSATEPLNPTDALYREQLVFSGSEEKQPAREPRVGGERRASSSRKRRWAECAMSSIQRPDFSCACWARCWPRSRRASARAPTVICTKR